MATTEKHLLENAICRVCLCTDKLMYNINGMDQYITELTGLSVNDWTVSRLLCWECRARLTNAIDFRKKAIVSSMLLDSLLKTGSLSELPKEREKHNLISSLKVEQFSPNFADYNFVYDPKADCGPPPRKSIKANARNRTVDAITEVKIEPVLEADVLRPEIDKFSHTDDNSGSLHEDLNFSCPNNAIFGEILNNSQITSVSDRDSGIDTELKIFGNVLDEKSTVISADMEDPLITATKSEFDIFEVKSEPTVAVINTVQLPEIHLSDGLTVKFQNIDSNDVSDENSETTDDDQCITDNDCDDDSVVFKSDVSDDDGIENSDDEELVKIAKRVLGRKEVEKISKRVAGMIERGKRLYYKEKKMPRKSDVNREDKKIVKEKREQKAGRRPRTECQLNDNIFITTIIPHNDQLQEIENRKCTTNYKCSRYKCVKCFKGFKHEDAFKTHMARHSEQAGCLECDVCKLRFKSGNKLSGHAQLHSRKYSCKLCSYVTNDLSSARLHEKFHDGLTYKCPQCPEVYQKMSSYLSHLRLQHKSDFVCELCGNSFVSKLGLTQHKSLKHRFDTHQEVSPEGPSCEDCNIQFLNQQALDTHIKESAKHATPAANKGARRAFNYRRESRRVVERPKGPLPCEICDEQLPNFSAYYHHFKREHPGKTRSRYSVGAYTCMCEQCGRMFANSTLLEDHKLTHTGKQFKCSQCEKTFPQRTALLRHEKYHSEDLRKHPCNVCGREFTLISNLRRHKRTHSDVRPHKCDICDKWFKSKGERRNHTMYVHLKKPWPKRDRGSRQKNSKQEANDSA